MKRFNKAKLPSPIKLITMVDDAKFLIKDIEEEPYRIKAIWKSAYRPNGNWSNNLGHFPKYKEHSHRDGFVVKTVEDYYEEVQ